ncbi:hypothetical protein FNV43_RR01335 [Rhamnella rubrinervis]|uniref:Uncharacterized protein n=1 Tax=Rhamnella rubrinervis TaxID=2594499 RepID=A0A8K0MRY8_9ROSA|nr:hypothetical protein FNV43_RR01335 [Rhamnella rubrinervis]
MFVSKKRKQLSSSSSLSHPFLGISTRSKSQFRLHRNRSGRARPDPTRPMNRAFEIQSSKSLCKRPRSGNPNPETLNHDNVFLNTPIKDLRTRRVFSSKSEPSKTITDQEFGVEIGCDEAEDDGKASKKGRTERFGDGFSFDGRNMDGKKGAESEITEKINLGFSSETQFLNDSDPRLGLLGEINGLCALEHSGGDDGNGNPKGIDNSVEKCSQTTPEKPDDSVIENCGNTMESVTEKPSNGNAQDGTLKIDKHSSLYNGLMGKKLQAGLPSQCEEASIERINRDIDLTECHTSHSDAETKMVVDSFDESSSGEELILTSKNITESPSGMVVDNCWSKPPVNEQNEILDVKFSCKEQKLTNLDSCVSVIVEDLQIVEDNIISVSTDDTKPVKNDKKDAEVQNGQLRSISSSSIMDDGHLHKDNELVQYSDNSKQSLFEGMKNFDIEYCSKIQKFNQLEQRSGDESEVLHQIDDPNEESIQMTPPDAEIFDKRDIEENGVDRGEYVLQKRDDGLGKSLDGLHHRNSSLADSKKCKMVLNPLSRMKVFKTPGSFNYRRLLPFLTDIAKDNPSVSVNGSYLKPEKVLEQKLVSPMFGSNDWEIPLDKSIDSGLHTENQTCDSGILLTASLTSANDSSNDKEPSTVSPEHSTELQMSFDSGKEQLADKASEFEAFTDISRSVQGPDLSVPSCHSINCEASSREECAMSLSDHLYVYTEGESSRSVMESSDNVKDTKVDRFYQNSSPHETPISSGLHDVGLKKGILKRIPRGCRGLCTCLNCASFRLHAERAFEFSRNQMEDAKEVALDLIKELSHLRAIFEKSDAGANDHFVVHVNQVKKACNKASEAEEQARIRLTQMNNDLDLHCRITRLERPRVRFANCVEVNSRANFPSND